MRRGIGLTICFLAILIVLAFCVRSYVRDPIKGWAACESNNLPQVEMKDYKPFVQHLPAEEKKCADIFILGYYDNQKGQHAIRIEFPLNGKSIEYTIIYDDSTGKRLKVIRRITGFYMS